MQGKIFIVHNFVNIHLRHPCQCMISSNLDFRFGVQLKIDQTLDFPKINTVFLNDRLYLFLYDTRYPMLSNMILHSYKINRKALKIVAHVTGFAHEVERDGAYDKCACTIPACFQSFDMVFFLRSISISEWFMLLLSINITSIVMSIGLSQVFVVLRLT